ncbi:type II secretion system F family protein [Flavobacterium sp.]|uniref:type II secretion system F family protein n=1 Tax=Flavobacterium sp. TaxID=239 RepID=UPI00261369CF|nr:type II secretion system F family protein [Flavobacterium sp.]
MNIELRLAKFGFTFVRAIFYLNLAKSLKITPGVTIYEMLKKIAARYPETATGIVVTEMVKTYPSKAQFSEVIKEFIPDEDYTVIASAEASGDLSGALLSLGQSIQNFSKIRLDLLKKIAIPLIVVVVCHIFFGVLGFYVIPEIVRTIQYGKVTLDKLGFSGKYISFLHTVFNYWYLFYGFEIALIVGTFLMLKNYVGRARNWLDDTVLPFILYRSFHGASLLMTCANLARPSGSRVPNLREVLLKVRETTRNKWVLYHLDSILTRYASSPESGFNIFDTGVLDKNSFYRLIDIESHSGGSSALAQVEEIVVEEMPKVVNRQAFLIWFFVVAVFIGSTVFTYMEILDLINSFKNYKTIYH